MSTKRKNMISFLSGIYYLTEEVRLSLNDCSSCWVGGFPVVKGTDAEVTPPGLTCPTIQLWHCGQFFNFPFAHKMRVRMIFYDPCVLYDMIFRKNELVNIYKNSVKNLGHIVSNSFSIFLQ